MPPGLEAAAVGVEQVRRAVQGDHGLAGAGPAGDLGDAARGRPDRLVLVAWMVATMSRMRAPRVRVSAAISAPSPTTTRSVRRLRHHQVVLDRR